VNARLIDKEAEAAAEAALAATTVGVLVSGGRVVLTDAQCDAALAKWRGTGLSIRECLYQAAWTCAADRYARKMQAEVISQGQQVISYEHLYRRRRRRAKKSEADSAVYIVLVVMVLVAVLTLIMTTRPV
jgi:hypothetical protein